MHTHPEKPTLPWGGGQWCRASHSLRIHSEKTSRLHSTLWLACCLDPVTQSERRKHNFCLMLDLKWKDFRWTIKKKYYPHVDTIVCFHSAKRPQRVFYILYLRGGENSFLLKSCKKKNPNQNNWSVSYLLWLFSKDKPQLNNLKCDLLSSLQFILPNASEYFFLKQANT